MVERDSVLKGGVLQGPDFRIEEKAHSTKILIQCSRPATHDFIAPLEDCLGLDFPHGPDRFRSGAQGVHVIWMTPCSWLVVAAAFVEKSLFEKLHALCKDTAGMAANLTDMMVETELSGTGSIDLLSSGCPLDLEGFGPGNSARSLLAQVPITLIQKNDTTYSLFWDVSLSGFMWDWIKQKQ